MLKIQQNVSLKPYNTFAIDVKASFFVVVTTEEELREVLLYNKITKPFFILSGGSNMLLTKDIDALVIHIAIKGVFVQETTEDSVIVKVNGGENWHEFVHYCIRNGYGGVENLSLIPGCVGSAPIQNIGAYGVELKDTFLRCEALDIKTGEKKIFSKEACDFGYRNSIFKTTAKGEYVITCVYFQLTTKDHQFQTGYGAIEKELQERGIDTPTLKEISESIIAIRQSKLPDPKVLGNSGSFFKNPVVSSEVFVKLQQVYPKVPHYVLDQGLVKVPAGWLVEEAGFKGKRYGDAGVHDKQALVLVNHGNATGKEILALSQRIQITVLEKFGISLEAEVNVI